MVRISGLSWSKVPRFVKVVLVLQAVVIVGLSVWMYKEYASNAYLQTYLFSLFQGKGSIIAVLGLGGLLGTALVGILLKAGNILGEIENLSEKVQRQTGATQVRAETPMTMPVLKVVVAEPVDEIGRLHRSLQRWNEKSKPHQ
jgi:hypothetical protein